MHPTVSIEVDPSNAGTLAAWDGPDGDHWVANEPTFDASLARYRQPFLDAAGIAADDVVLDIGCGTGQSTCDAARLAASGSALGVDLSARMLRRARQRAAEQGIGNAHFLQADAQIHAFDPESFSVAISHTGAMFFGDPVAAFANIARAVRPGGRLVLLVWQPLAHNQWVRGFATALAGGRDLPAPPPDAPGPFSLSDPDRARSILTTAGFTDVTLTGVEEPQWFGATADDACRFVRGLGFAKNLLGDLDHAARARALAALRAEIAAHVTSDGVLYPSALWIICARRP
jgi:SAM-dependent methyltransferase